MASTAAVDHEITLLCGFIRTLGTKNQTTNKYEVTFGTLFKDDKLSNTLESLAGTLKAAKRKKIVSYQSELLLQGMSDKELITLLQDE